MPWQILAKVWQILAQEDGVQTLPTTTLGILPFQTPTHSQIQTLPILGPLSTLLMDKSLVEASGTATRAMRRFPTAKIPDGVTVSGTGPGTVSVTVSGTVPGMVSGTVPGTVPGTVSVMVSGTVSGTVLGTVGAPGTGTLPGTVGVMGTGMLPGTVGVMGTGMLPGTVGVPGTGTVLVTAIK
jgi:hypothetical protein